MQDSTHDSTTIPLSMIDADPGRFQKRAKPFSERTVAAIVAGFDPSKFDALPVIPALHGRYIVAGDGHSRLEALKRLANSGQLPAAWSVPARQVSDEDAQCLAWTANLSRDDFTPLEQAAVFREMQQSGLTLSQIEALTHRTASYIRQTMALTVLARCIQERVGLSPDAGGIEPFVAKAMAGKFQQHRISVEDQTRLFHSALAGRQLSAPFVRALIDRLAKAMKKADRKECAEVDSIGLFGAESQTIEQTAAKLDERMADLRRAEKGLSIVLSIKDRSVLDPDLAALLNSKGRALLEAVRENIAADADLMLANLA